MYAIMQILFLKHFLLFDFIMPIPVKFLVSDTNRYCYIAISK